MINKIKSKLLASLRNYLGIYKLEQECLRLNKALGDSQSELSQLKSALKVGVDYHENPSASSWAIVCLDGKHEYIKLMSFNNTDGKGIREIKDFLRNFREENVIIDRRPGIDRSWFFEKGW